MTADLAAMVIVGVPMGLLLGRLWVIIARSRMPTQSIAEMCRMLDIRSITIEAQGDELDITYRFRADNGQPFSILEFRIATETRSMLDALEAHLHRPFRR